MIVHDKTSIGDGLSDDSMAIRELTEDELESVSGGGEGGNGGEGGGGDNGDGGRDPGDQNPPGGG